MIFQRVYIFESEGFGLFQYYHPTEGVMVSNTVHIELEEPLGMSVYSSTHEDHSSTSVLLEFSAKHLDQIASAWIRARRGEIPAYFRSPE